MFLFYDSHLCNIVDYLLLITSDVFVFAEVYIFVGGCGVMCYCEIARVITDVINTSELYTTL